MLSNWSAATFQALRNRHFRMLWIGTSFSFLAFNMSWIVQAVVAFDITGKNTSVGVVFTGMGIATLFIAPFGGVIADRVSKRRLLFLGQSAMCVTFFVVGVLVLTDRITILWLFVSTLLMGLVFSFIAPARQAWVGELLPSHEIPNGVALTQVAMAATRVIGPALAAIFLALAFVGAGGTYLLMGVFLAIVVGTLVLLPPTRSTPAEDRSPVLVDLRSGYRHISDRPRLRLLVLSFIGLTVTAFSSQVVFPGLLENELGIDPEVGIGPLYVVSAVAGLIATVLLAAPASGRHAWRLMLFSGIALGVGTVGMGFVPSYFALVALMIPVGVAMSAFQLLNNALVMRESEPAFYGRVMSLTMIAWGLNSLAGLPFGMLADGTGERAALVVMGVLATIVAVGAMLLFAPLREQESRDHLAATAARLASTAATSVGASPIALEETGND
jgi:MFS family permease